MSQRSKKQKQRRTEVNCYRHKICTCTIWESRTWFLAPLGAESWTASVQEVRHLPSQRCGVHTLEITAAMHSPRWPPAPGAQMAILYLLWIACFRSATLQREGGGKSVIYICLRTAFLIIKVTLCKNVWQMNFNQKFPPNSSKIYKLIVPATGFHNQQANHK